MKYRQYDIHIHDDAIMTEGAISSREFPVYALAAYGVTVSSSLVRMWRKQYRKDHTCDYDNNKNKEMIT